MSSISSQENRPDQAKEAVKFAKNIHSLLYSKRTKEKKILNIIKQKPTVEQFGTFTKNIQFILAGVAVKKIRKEKHPEWIKHLITKKNDQFYELNFDESFTIDRYCTTLLDAVKNNDPLINTILTPNDRFLSTPLHIAIQWESEKSTELILWLLNRFPNYIFELDGMGTHPLSFAVAQTHIDCILEYVMTHKHPTTPDDFTENESTIYHFKWLETLLLSKNEALILAYFEQRPWSFIPVNIVSDSISENKILSNYCRSVCPTQVLSLCDDILLSKFELIWDEKIKNLTQIPFYIILRMERMQFFELNTLEDVIVNYQSNWLLEHPLYYTYFPNVHQYCSCPIKYVNSILGAYHFWYPFFSIKPETETAWAEFQCKLNDSVLNINDIIPLLNFFSHHQDAALTLLHNTLNRFIQNDLYELNLKDISDNIYRDHLTFFENPSKFSEKFILTLLNFFLKTKDPKKSLHAIPLILLIKNLKAVKTVLKKFQGIDSAVFLDALNYHLLRTQRDYNEVFDTSIISAAIKIGLLDSPKELCHINPLSSILTSSNEHSYSYLKWIFKKLVWARNYVDYPTTVINRISGEYLLDPYHHLLYVKGIPFTGILEKKIQFILKHLKYLPNRVTVQLLQYDISSKSIGFMSKCLTEQQIKHLLNEIFDCAYYGENGTTIKQVIKNFIKLIEQQSHYFIYQIFKAHNLNIEDEKISDEEELLSTGLITLLPQVNEEKVSQMKTIASTYDLKFSSEEDSNFSFDNIDLYYFPTRLKVIVVSSLPMQFEDFDIDPLNLHLLENRFKEFLETKIAPFKSMERFLIKNSSKYKYLSLESTNGLMKTFSSNNTQSSEYFIYFVERPKKFWIAHPDFPKFIVQTKPEVLESNLSLLTNLKNNFSHKTFKKIFNSCESIIDFLRIHKKILSIDTKIILNDLLLFTTRIKKKFDKNNADFNISLFTPTLILMIERVQDRKQSIYVDFLKKLLYAYVYSSKIFETRYFENTTLFWNSQSLNESRKATLEKILKLKNKKIELEASFHRIKQRSKSIKNTGNLKPTRAFEAKRQYEVITSSSSSSSGSEDCQIKYARITQPNEPLEQFLSSQFQKSLGNIVALESEETIGKIDDQIKSLKTEYDKLLVCNMPEEVTDTLIKALLSEKYLEIIDVEGESLPRYRVLPSGIYFILEHLDLLFKIYDVHGNNVSF